MGIRLDKGVLTALLVLGPGSVGPAGAASVIATVTVGSGPVGVGVNPNTDKIYVANNGSNTVSVISAATHAVTTIALGAGNGPFGVAVNSVTNKIYVSNNTSGTVSVIDGATDTLLPTIPAVGTSLEDIAVNPVTNMVYVAQFLVAGQLTVIDGATDTVQTTIGVGAFSNGVAVNSRTNRVYVSNSGSGNISVINGATNMVVSTIAAGFTNPNGLDVDPVLNKIFVTDVTAANVKVIDGGTETLDSTTAVGANPEGLAYSTLRNRLYVANGAVDNVSVINATIATVGQTVAVGDGPRGVDVHDAMGRIYVSNANTNTVSVLGDALNFRSIGVLGPDSSGQVTTVTNSRIVNGSGGQTWQSSNRGRGDLIAINGVNYTVFSVDSNTRITLTRPFAEVGGSHPYTIARQFSTLAAWEDCIDGQGATPPPAAPCFYFPAPTASLVADERSEVGIAYNDGIFNNVVFNGATPDSVHDITLTAAPGNRHDGVGTPSPAAGSGVLLHNNSGANAAVEISDPFVTVEWLEVREGSAPADGIQFTTSGKVVVSYRP